MKIKVMTFNTQHCLNYVKQEIDFDIMSKTILDCDADIVALNEMRGLGTDPNYTAQVETLARLTRIKHFYFAKAIDTAGGPYGNGILSKIPILDARIITIPDPLTKSYSQHYETRCVLKASLEGGITVLVTHMGLNPDEKQNAISIVTSQITDQRCILMGDFNMTPNDPLLFPISDRMKDTAICFDNEKLSFPSDHPVRKIDYIFVSNDIEVISADIPSIVASDHRPQIAEIILN